jgi:hypothetical protein
MGKKTKASQAQAGEQKIKAAKGKKQWVAPVLPLHRQRHLNDLELDQMDRSAELLNTVIEEHAKAMDTNGRFDALLRLHHTEHGLPYLPRKGVLAPWCTPVYTLPQALERDIAQFEYLLTCGALGTHVERFIRDGLMGQYRAALGLARAQLSTHTDVPRYAVLQPNDKDLGLFFGVFGRALHVHPGNSVSGSALNPEVDFSAVERDYLAAEHRCSVIDGLLSPACLATLRAWLLESTVWSASPAKPSYMGAYLEAGFATPLVAQIEAELRTQVRFCPCPPSLDQYPLSLSLTVLYLSAA